MTRFLNVPLDASDVFIMTFMILLYGTYSCRFLYILLLLYFVSFTVFLKVATIQYLDKHNNYKAMQLLPQNSERYKQIQGSVKS